MATAVGSLILFSADLSASLAFYRAIGLALGEESHGDGPEHHACDIGGVHVAIFDAAGQGPGRALDYRSAGSSYVGFTVESVAATVERLRADGTTVVQEPAQFPWGVRALVKDPDGRVVELFESGATVKE